MIDETSWIPVPVLLGDEQHARVTDALTQAGVAYLTGSVATGSAVGGGHAYGLQVKAEQVGTAARLLCHLWELEDPADDEPFTGTCPACETEVVEAWSCPDCEISFRAPQVPDSALIVFLREHGGFEPA